MLQIQVYTAYQLEWLWKKKKKKIMKKIKADFVPNPEFDPLKERMASSTAEGLCRWVKAMEIYDRVAKVKQIVLLWSHIS